LSDVVKPLISSRFVNIGYGNVVAVDKIITIVNPDPAPIKRAVQEARETGRVVDATHGRKTRAVIFSTDGLLILSSLQPETISQRVM